MAKTNNKAKPYHRGEALTAELNDVLKEITGHKKDFTFANDHLLQLKKVVSATNGLLTYRTTVLAMKWLKKQFSIPDADYKKAYAKIKGTSPYTSGFDILIPDYGIVAEVKCYLPINDGELFGTAQVNGILNDAIKLHQGKKSQPNTKRLYKFIFLARVPKKTEKAIRSMRHEWKMISTNAKRIEMNEIKKRLEFLDGKSSLTQFSKNKIYIVEV